MYLSALIWLPLIGLALGQTNVECPTHDDMLNCSWTHVKELATKFTTPIHNMFSSKSFFITPLGWNRYETEEVCRVKEDYKKFLLCALDLRRRCMLDEFREVIIETWKINRVMDILCDHFWCTDCTRILCDLCGPDKFFNYSCTTPKIVEIKTCMGEYETRPFDRQAYADRQRVYTFTNYTCDLINHRRLCEMRYYGSCGEYTRNLTGWFTLEARPQICSATVSHLSGILILLTAILNIVHLVKR